ncbi:MAG TPA: 4-(cytidine 5'-diphospho)-2-C-methyl-D-erythritol kinase [Nitriliruptorales bacterium]|nr:4-(cytidine 5'-diphospho)-2-C-methyl-D-erythritol kinase [Nitriliruptorales bacterium]
MTRAPAGLARVAVRVPAKINLFLAVRGRRDDGMHDIVSIMHTVGVHDVVTVAFGGPRAAMHHPAGRRVMEVELQLGTGGGAPPDDANLAVRAARALASSAGNGWSLRRGGGGRGAAERGRQWPVTRVRLDKRIPVGAGMAGGSADAAGTLIALNRLWDCDLSLDQLRDIGAALGADVPFCVGGGTALATGTGVTTAQVLCRGRFQLVLGISDRPLATADVYRCWDEIGVASRAEPDAVLQALRTADPVALGEALHNDLQPAAFHLRPELRARRDALLAAGALGVVVSGSGPTLVGLTDGAQAARRVARAVRHLFDRVEVARSPAGGPEVVEER